MYTHQCSLHQIRETKESKRKEKKIQKEKKQTKEKTKKKRKYKYVCAFGNCTYCTSSSSRATAAAPPIACQRRCCSWWADGRCAAAAPSGCDAWSATADASTTHDGAATFDAALPFRCNVRKREQMCIKMCKKLQTSVRFVGIRIFRAGSAVSFAT